jgi:glycine/D-amino acid oxidase-like deaminating enzyme
MRCRALLSPARYLRRFASTANSDYDVVIAGGGIIGASVAYHLAAAKPSLKICVVERDPSYAVASAVLSAGGIRQQFSLSANIQLSLYGIDFMRSASSLLAVPGENAPDLQLREQGYLFLASEAGEPTLRRNVATQRACGVDWTTLLSPAEMAARFPWLNTDGLSLGCFGALLPHPHLVPVRAPNLPKRSPRLAVFFGG